MPEREIHRPHRSAGSCDVDPDVGCFGEEEGDSGALRLDMPSLNDVFECPKQVEGSAHGRVDPSVRIGVIAGVA